MEDLTSKSDDELVEASKKGDSNATETLMLRYKSAVRARAHLFFIEGGEVEDLVQEGLIGLYLAILSFNPNLGKKFKNFAYLCMTRRIVDAIKRMNTKKNAILNESVSLFDQNVVGLSDDGLSPEELVIIKEARSELLDRLSEVLSKFEYRVLTLYMDGMSYEQICKATNKPSKSIDNALARAKKKAQKALSQ